MLLDFFLVGFIAKRGLFRLETKAHVHSVLLATSVEIPRMQDHHAGTVNFHWVAGPFARYALQVGNVLERIAAQ